MLAAGEYDRDQLKRSDRLCEKPCSNSQTPRTHCSSRRIRSQVTSTLAHLLQEQARAGADRLACSFYPEGKSPRVDLTFGELHERAVAIAGQIRQRAEFGDRALLLFPPGLDFITSLFGCLYAGVIAVPTYPPHPRRLDHSLPRLTAIAENCQPKLILTTGALSEVLSPLLPCLAVDQLPAPQPGLGDSKHTLPAEITADHVAILQYTSGSTGTPRGVTLRHAHLMANLNLIQQGFGTTSDSVGVFWLPFYHDMGLIGGVLQTVYCGGRSVFMSPASFVQSPIRWLQAISHERATISGAPNFAYEECVRRIDPEQCADLDLSSWKLAFCGAEPIRQQTLAQFAEKFAPYGFDAEAFFPCYGLAEATLMVSGGWLSPAKRQSTHVGRPEHLPDERPHTTCGRPLGGQRVVIADPETLASLPAGQIGEIWVAGPSVAAGYWHRPDESQATFAAYLADTNEGPFLRTGDLGYLHEGELFVTGRQKDMIIVGGRNHYPQDLEQTAERSHDALLPGCCAAFEVNLDGVSRVVIAAEIDRHQQRAMASEANNSVRDILQNIRRALAQQHAVELHAAVLVRRAYAAANHQRKTETLCLPVGISGWRTGPSGRLKHSPTNKFALQEENIMSRAVALVGHVAAIPRHAGFRPRRLARCQVGSLAGAHDHGHHRRGADDRPRGGDQFVVEHGHRTDRALAVGRHVWPDGHGLEPGLSPSLLASIVQSGPGRAYRAGSPGLDGGRRPGHLLGGYAPPASSIQRQAGRSAFPQSARHWLARLARRAVARPRRLAVRA